MFLIAVVDIRVVVIILGNDGGKGIHGVMLPWEIDERKIYETTEKLNENYKIFLSTFCKTSCQCYMV